METPNILLITIDALRYDHLGCYGYHRETSPNVDALAARGVKFLQAISNGGQTPQAFPSILASALPPLRKANKSILRQNVMLAEALKQTGYQTAAFHSNPHLSRFYGYDRGFDTFEDNMGEFGFGLGKIRRWLRTRSHFKSPVGLFVKFLQRLAKLLLAPVVFGAGVIIAENINDQVNLWLETCHGNFFLWIHYMDVHQPYIAPPQYISHFCDQPIKRSELRILFNQMRKRQLKTSSPKVAHLIDLYDAEVKYTDDCIKSLLDGLGDKLANTVVIITADHGDEFGEHGRFSHNTVYDGILRVPLIMAGPGIEGGTVVKQQVSLIDLAPTITDLVGIENPRSFQGESLLSALEGRNNAGTGTISTYVSLLGLRQRNIAYRIPAWKYILTESLDEGRMLSEELYDLRNDPGETNNLHGVGNGEANRFELEAKKKIAQFKHLKAKGKTDYEKQRIRAKLSRVKKL